jgi:hypothetical protein
MFKVGLRQYQSTFDLADRKEARVFVTLADNDVVTGFVSLIDYSRKFDMSGAVNVFISAIATDVRHRQDGTVLTLFTAANDWVERNHAFYRGVICAPGGYPTLIALLDRLGFRQAPDEGGYFWWRPIQ